MKRCWKILITIVLMIGMVLILSSCGEKQTGNRITSGKDVQTFNYCFVVLGGQEIVRGIVTNWRDYDNCDEVQVLVNGKYYLTHYSNVVLVADPSQGPLTYSDVTWNGGVHE